MTDEEYQAKVNEYNQLVNEYNYLVEENIRLEAELETGIENCYVVAKNISAVASPVSSKIEVSADNVGTTSGIIDKLYALLVDITENYFLFKNLSTASKNLTQFNDIYYTKYKFYNELRRIALGYVIGIDSHIVSSEALRKKVEKAYLANTDYWLAYAISAVMLWASNEKEAAYRALNKSISMDVIRSSIFFMLVNIRFERMDTARNWFVLLLEKTNVNEITEEWQHIMRLYLIGALKGDNELSQLADSYFDKMLEQTKATNVEFMKRVRSKAYNYAKTYIHKTDEEYPVLKDFSADYPEMKNILNESEKIALISKYFYDIYTKETDTSISDKEEIENVLYSLISSYDQEEFKIVKEIKLNEAIMAAKGDVAAADAKFQAIYGEMYQTHTLGELMIIWAFADDLSKTDITVKRFAIASFKEQIAAGICDYFNDIRNSMKERYKLNVAIIENMSPLQIECSENEYESAEQKITEHFEKNQFRYAMNDRYLKIFLLMCAGALLLLALAALTLHSTAFPVFLTLGIALGIVGGFLVWRRWTDLTNTLREHCRQAKIKFRNALEEMQIWRKTALENFGNISTISEIIEKFSN